MNKYEKQFETLLSLYPDIVEQDEGDVVIAFLRGNGQTRYFYVLDDSWAHNGQDQKFRSAYKFLQTLLDDSQNECDNNEGSPTEYAKYFKEFLEKPTANEFVVPGWIYAITAKPLLRTSQNTFSGKVQRFVESQD